MTIRKVEGFTLIEMLVVLAIVAIGLSFAAPSWTRFVEMNYRKTVSAELVSIFNLSRTVAISEGLNVTVCPLDANGVCTHQWTSPISAFRDPRRQRKLTQPDQLIRTLEAPKQGKMRGATSNRRYFGFQPDGIANYATGNLIWCPEDGDARNALQIRINMGGRPILARDTNGDGIVEDAYGKPVVCRKA